MAEARRAEEDEERREQRDVRIRNHTTDHPERTKPDHILSGQGPLSSIRAAIKRTRTQSQCDHTRERRRPEITIVSAEPLARNSWFSGRPLVLPPPPPQSVLTPPSYDQVIQEKNQEDNVAKPTAAPRRTSCTATSATQTDPPVKENASQSAAKSEETRPAGKKKPQKPPRPHLPKQLEPEPAKKVETNAEVTPNTEDQSGSWSDVTSPNQDVSTHKSARSVTVHWDIPTNPLAAAAAETTPCSSDSEQIQRPVPLPRTVPRRQVTPEEVDVQTLVKFSENCDNVHFDPSEVSSNTYLKELLEVFGADNQCEDIVDRSDGVLLGEDAGSEMSVNQSQSKLLARIQAFESIDGRNGTGGPAKPEPRLRRASTGAPVAVKPLVANKPQLSINVDHLYETVSSGNIYQSPTAVPVPAPRPQTPKKPNGLSIKDELETIHKKAALIPNRLRPSVLTRADSIYEDEPTPGPPQPPPKPAKEPLRPNFNFNNHNSASTTNGNEYVESPSSANLVKPQRNVDSNGISFPRPSVTRRPTTIRVPSQSGSLSDGFQDSPPPLPVQKPVGHLNASVNHQHSPTPFLPSQESHQHGPEPSLPPRRLTKSVTLPPRPPPAKTGPGRPPPPNRASSTSWEGSPKPQAQKPQRKGPVLPPRPNPGHRLYNKYTLELSHGIAIADYNGSHTGELSFQKNEVLLLLGEIDRNTFECQVGDSTGRVQKSRLKVITPLASVSQMSPPQAADTAGHAGLKVQATHDFNPEGPGELALRAGDVVTSVEQVDSEWYTGTCRGSSGFFPVNHVKVLSKSPKPLPGRKAKPTSATVSGPRCVARFDFEGENGSELSFSEGDVIQLKALVGEEWAQGQVGGRAGIFPLNFVEVIEDLPPPPSQQLKRQSTKIALPGLAASPSTHPEAAKPAQPSQSSVEWAVALYDYDGSSEGDLSFHEGDRIQITQHIDAEWSSGRLNGREGIFPTAFVESSSGQQSSGKQPNTSAAGGKAKALFDFTSDCEEELSLRAGDILTNLESLDDEWFLADLRGNRALVPKNYVEVLG